MTASMSSSPLGRRPRRFGGYDHSRRRSGRRAAADTCLHAYDRSGPDVPESLRELTRRVIKGRDWIESLAAETLAAETLAAFRGRESSE